MNEEKNKRHYNRLNSRHLHPNRTKKWFFNLTHLIELKRG